MPLMNFSFSKTSCVEITTSALVSISCCSIVLVDRLGSATLVIPPTKRGNQYIVTKKNRIDLSYLRATPQRQ